MQRHDEHLANQSQGNLDQLYNNYAEHAVVEDSMYPHPSVGRAAIMSRKSAGMAAMPGLKINVTNRIAHGNQLTVNGVLPGPMRGITLVSLLLVARSLLQELLLSYVRMAKLFASHSITT